MLLKLSIQYFYALFLRDELAVIYENYAALNRYKK